MVVHSDIISLTFNVGSACPWKWPSSDISLEEALSSIACWKLFSKPLREEEKIVDISFRAAPLPDCFWLLNGIISLLSDAYLPPSLVQIVVFDCIGRWFGLFELVLDAVFVYQ